MKLLAFMAALCVVPFLSTPSFAQSITLPAGNELHVQFITMLSSKTNEAGDFWSGKVVEPIFGQGGEIVPDGSTVDGHITFEKNQGQAKGKNKDNGEMLLIPDSISTPDGSKYNITVNSGAAPSAQTKQPAPGALTAQARNFAPKKGKETVIPQGTEVTFLISHDTTATKVVAHPVSSSN